jgi:hypothetical protein
VAIPARAGLRAKPYFLNRINVICPVQSGLQKYSGFRAPQITFITPPSRPTRGALAIVIDAGRDAVDAKARFDETC